MFDNLRRWWKSEKSSKRPARKNPLRQWSFRPMLEALEPRWVPSAPTVTGVTPNSGSTAAATPVVIDGTGFSTATAVYFGSTQVEFDAPSGSDTVIDAYSPSSAAAGTVDVTVVNPDGTSATSSADQFTFVAPPVITSISPAGGPTTGDTQVLITGTGFTAATGVTFNSNLPASYEVQSDTEILATSPAYSYNYDVPVQVTTPYGTSPQGNGSYFQYASPTAPTVTSISSSTGPTGGGTEVEIDGSNFTNATAVDFGGVPAELRHRRGQHNPGLVAAPADGRDGHHGHDIQRHVGNLLGGQVHVCALRHSCHARQRADGRRRRGGDRRQRIHGRDGGPLR